MVAACSPVGCALGQFDIHVARELASGVLSVSVSEMCQHPAGLPGFVRHLPRGGSAAAYVTVSESGVKKIRFQTFCLIGGVTEITT